MAQVPLGCRGPVRFFYWIQCSAPQGYFLRGTFPLGSFAGMGYWHLISVFLVRIVYGEVLGIAAELRKSYKGAGSWFGVNLCDKKTKKELRLLSFEAEAFKQGQNV